MLIDDSISLPLAFPIPLAGHAPGMALGWLPAAGAAPVVECVDDPDDEEDDLGDEEDLAVGQPLADEESSFDDFDDEFDDDFEEEENDPDWDHPDDADEEPPPAKGPGKKK
jgi:hypothetical protein